MRNAASQKLANVVLKRRLELGLRQVDVGKELGITGEAVGMIEAGSRRILLKHVPALARVLEMEVREFAELALRETEPRLFEALFETEHT